MVGFARLNPGNGRGFRVEITYSRCLEATTSEKVLAINVADGHGSEACAAMKPGE